MLKDKIISDDALDSVSGGVIVSQDEKTVKGAANENAEVPGILKPAGSAKGSGKTIVQIMGK